MGKRRNGECVERRRERGIIGRVQNKEGKENRVCGQMNGVREGRVKNEGML